MRVSIAEDKQLEQELSAFSFRGEADTGCCVGQDMIIMEKDG